MQHPNESTAGGDTREEELLSTGDMARLTGNTLRTVRFYEEAGILRPERRSAGGHRLFHKNDLGRLQLISELRAAGLSLEEIRELLELKAQCATAATASKALTLAIERQLALLDQRLTVLTRLRRELLTTRRIMRDCGACTNSDFPEVCNDCEELASHGELPATMRVLWSVRSD